VISGRRGAPGHLGAFFNKLPGAQVGIGSYEAFSGTVDAPGPAEQTLLGVVQVMAAAGPYTVWAENSGSGFVDQPSRNRLLYPLNAQQILASEKMIGEAPAYLAVFTDRPGDLGTVGSAFEDTRYQWSKTEAVYSQADQNRVPKMQFLHWAMLRPAEDQKGRTEEATFAAARLGGALVFPIQAPVTGGDRERPQATFRGAFEAQFPNGGGFLPQVVDGPAAAADVRVAAQQTAAKNALLVVAVFGGLALAGYAGYRATRSLRGQPA
jgi:hypothetical protein